jgi:hypothetical protein
LVNKIRVVHVHTLTLPSALVIVLIPLLRLKVPQPSPEQFVVVDELLLVLVVPRTDAGISICGHDWFDTYHVVSSLAFREQGELPAEMLARNPA